MTVLPPQPRLPTATLPKTALPGAGLPVVRWWPGLGQILAVLVLVPLLLLGAITAGQWAIPDPPDRRPWMLTPPGGDRRTAAFPLAVAVDNSGSMATSDKSGARAAMVTALLDWLREHGAPEDEVAVLSFATRPVGWGLMPVTAAPRTLPDGDVGAQGTLFTPAINDAGARLAARRAGQGAVLLLTDGEGDDPSAAISRLPASTRVYVIGLDDSRLWSKRKSRWTAAGMDRSWRAEHLSQKELAQPLAELLSELTGQTVTAQPQKRSRP